MGVQGRTVLGSSCLIFSLREIGSVAMKSMQDRIDELEARVQALEGKSERVSNAERDLLEAARNLGRVRRFGWFIDRCSDFLIGIASSSRRCLISALRLPRNSSS